MSLKIIQLLHPPQAPQLFSLSKFATTFAQKLWNAPCQRFQTHSRKPNYAMFTPPLFGIWPSSPACTRLIELRENQNLRKQFSSVISRISWFIVLICNPCLWGRTSYLHHKTCDAFWGFVLDHCLAAKFEFQLLAVQFFGEKRMSVVEWLCWRTPSRKTWWNPLAKDKCELAFFLMSTPD